jgi:hypothetical protein
MRRWHVCRHSARGLVVRLDPERYQRRSGVKLSLLDLPFLPDEMRDVLPGADSVALALET